MQKFLKGQQIQQQYMKQKNSKRNVSRKKRTNLVIIKMMMVIMIAVDTKLKKRVSSNDIIQNIVKTKKEYEKMIKAKNQESAKKKPASTKPEKKESLMEYIKKEM